jgi:hypothetical protein
MFFIHDNDDECDCDCKTVFLISCQPMEFR